MWNLINDVDILNYELECALDNLSAVHTAMEADEGANWKRYCNAVFSAYLQVHTVWEKMNNRTNQAVENLNAQRIKTV